MGSPAGGAAASLAELVRRLPAPTPGIGHGLAGLRTVWTEEGTARYLGAPAGPGFAPPRSRRDRVPEGPPSSPRHRGSVDRLSAEADAKPCWTQLRPADADN